ncbi:unnamed protein product [Cylicocyclus nassatus]|uniref:Uncharacterized protein n=1 Tax=Cylicocyclus nassatus TaxID=53992 RepID=A0AA36GJ13_CYLNA|nr:unnamed protein product [Cylicocyclus nassatus]
MLTFVRLHFVAVTNPLTPWYIDECHEVVVNFSSIFGIPSHGIVKKRSTYRSLSPEGRLYKKTNQTSNCPRVTIA